jgi:hypothetical protein
LLTSALFEARYDWLSYEPSQPGEELWTKTIGGVRHARYFTHSSEGVVRTDFGIRFDDQGNTRLKASELRAFSPAVLQTLGHSICSIVLGSIGALLASWFASNGRRASCNAMIGIDRPIDAGL